MLPTTPYYQFAPVAPTLFGEGDMVSTTNPSAPATTRWLGVLLGVGVLAGTVALAGYINSKKAR